MKLTLNSRNDRGTDHDRFTESSSAGVLSSLRCCYLTECEDTRDSLFTNGGISWGRRYARSLPLEGWSTSYSSGQSDRASVSDSASSNNGGGGRTCEGDSGWFCEGDK